MSGLSHELIEHEFNLMKVDQERSDKKIVYGVEYKRNYQHIIDIRQKSLGSSRREWRQQEPEKVIEDARKVDSTFSIRDDIKKSSSCDVIIGQFVDENDGTAILSDLTIWPNNIAISKNGGKFYRKSNPVVVGRIDNGFYTIQISENDTDSDGLLTIVVEPYGAFPVCQCFNVSPYPECSGCGKNDITVNRYISDGQCTECADRSLHDRGFNVMAILRNDELRNDILK